jgi:ABC-2 type transport system ATP-binding protein
MEEASVLCDEIAVIDRGRIIEQGRPERLLEKHFPRALVRIPRHALGPADDLPAGFELRGDYAVAATSDIDRVLSTLNRRGIALDELHISSPTLDDLFLKLTGHGLREA